MLVLNPWQVVDTYPQLFAYGSPPAAPNMLIVGGVTTDGNLWDRSRVDVPGNAQVIRLYAPSFNIMVPNGQTGVYRNPLEVQGVSYGEHNYSVLTKFLQREQEDFADFYDTSCCNYIWTGHIFLRTF